MANHLRRAVVLASLAVALVACQPGTPVAEFGAGGHVELPWAEEVWLAAPALALAPDGPLLVTSATGGSLWRIDPVSGAATDPGTGPGVRDWFDAGRVTTVHPTADGGAYLVGVLASGEAGVVKVTAAGLADASFSGDGIVPGLGSLASWLAADGTLVVVEPATGVDLAYRVRRISPSGAVQVGAWVPLPRGDLDAAPPEADELRPNLDVRRLAWTSAGLVAVASVLPDWYDVETGQWANLDPESVAFRLEADGSLDPTFGGDGLAVLHVGLDPSSEAVPTPDWEDTATDVAALPGGRLAVIGQARGTGGYPDTQGYVAVLGADGALDPAFGGDGMRTVRGSGMVVVQDVVATGPHGRIVVGGMVLGRTPEATSGVVARYDSTTGDLDPVFGAGGTVGFAGPVWGLALDAPRARLAVVTTRAAVTGSVAEVHSVWAQTSGV